MAEMARHNGTSIPEIIIDFEDMPPLPHPTALTAFRIVQEAVRNAIRHAEAREITIRICGQSDFLRLQVIDDGCGFSVPPRLNELADRGHFGLIGLVERVDQAQGTIKIESEPGLGTTIKVTIPVFRARELHA